MLKKLFSLLTARDCELKDRMFRSTLLMGGIATVVGIAEVLFIMNLTNLLVWVLISFVVIMSISIYLSFRHNKLDIAAMLVAVVIIVMIFPVMFCLRGGIYSGATMWFVLGIVYIFIMFNGKKLLMLLTMTVISYSGVFYLAYKFPELIVPLQSELVVYIDSLVSIFIIGITAGTMLNIQIMVFAEEHKLTIAQKEELEKLSNSKNTLFANMSHEIRTPINTIIGLNEMILREGPSEKIREYAQDIHFASKLLLNQVNDILDLSQMEMNKMSIVQDEYSTANLFGELVELTKVSAEKKGLELKVDIDKNLPSILIGDEKRLKQVILNLLDNAVKYTIEGSVTLSVNSEINDYNEATMVIKVADTGIGIRKEDLAYIYDSFKRADEKKNAQILGSGLGLAITKQLVDLMHGELTVDSIYTKGTTFTAIFTQKIVDSTPIGGGNMLKKAAKESGEYKASFEAPEARVLVVDDNRMNVKVAVSLLGATKVQVDVATSGPECLKMTKNKYYNVILLDHLMPGMDGIQTLKELRTQENGLCRESSVIALTANAVSGAGEFYMESGFDGYIEKPIKSRMLEKEILRMLPHDIIEYHENEDIENQEVRYEEPIKRRKSKKIYITADCVCDIPEELLEKYGIKLMYFYIKTPHGRFADTKEINPESIRQYLSDVDSTAFADGVTVEEVEQFFAETLTQAEHIIHISVGSRCSNAYNTALTAAKCFDHVNVIDSGQMSCGMGIVTLYAAKLASEGYSVDEIVEQIEKIKKNISTRIIMPGINIFYQNGRVRTITAKLCRYFNFHPYVAMKKGRAAIVGLLGGNLKSAWRQGIYWHLRNKKKINTDIVFISHVGCSVKQLEWIKKEILKQVHFEKVIIQGGSASTACNAGIGTIGISYYVNSKK